MTVTIDLPADGAARLAEIAAAQGVAPEVLARRVVAEWLARRRTFREAMELTFEKYAGLYRRLAAHEAAERADTPSARP